MLDLSGSLCQVGITTDEIDRIVHEAIVKEGACPSPLNYMGYPKVQAACCREAGYVSCWLCSPGNAKSTATHTHTHTTLHTQH
jgi:hypothetical protein